MTKLFPVFLAVVLTVSIGFPTSAQADDWTSVQQVSYSQVSASQPSSGGFVTQGTKGARLRWRSSGVVQASAQSYSQANVRSSVIPTQHIINGTVPDGRDSIPNPAPPEVINGINNYSPVTPIAPITPVSPTIPNTTGLPVVEDRGVAPIGESNIAVPNPLEQAPQDWMDPSSGTTGEEILEPQLPGQSQEEIQRGVRQIIDPQGSDLFTSDPCDGRAAFKPIGEISHSIAQEPGTAPGYCSLEGSDMLIPPREFCDLTFTWKASGMCHKPLYFDDQRLERYGHSWGPLLQPIISTGRFWATIPILPYKMGVHTPDECIYTLGHYRPNSCTPYMIDPLPLSVRGALFESAAWVGGVFLIP